MASAFQRPSFIVIGPGRSGTSWIYEVLREHPQVQTAGGTKETLFFDREYHRGLDWYLNFFPYHENCKAYGEVSNAYIYNPLCARRIRAHLPGVKLVTCLRNPVERLLSAHAYRLRRGQLKGDVEHCLGAYPDLITTNLYWTALKPFLNEPELDLHVMLYDDLQQDPTRFAQDLYSTIGVAEDFHPSVIDKTVNPASIARSPVHAKVSGFIADSLRRFGALGLLDSLKRSDFVRDLMLNKTAESDRSQGLLPETRRDLIEIFRPEINELSNYLGRDLDSWLS